MQKTAINSKNIVKKSLNYGDILKLGLNSTPKNKVLNEILLRLREKRVKNSKSAPLVIFTPNPEIIKMAHSDTVLSSALASADYLFADGLGLIQAHKFLSLPAPKNKFIRAYVLLYQGLLVAVETVIDRKKEGYLPRITGSKLFLDLIRQASKKGFKVMVVGNESALLAKKNILSSFPKLKVEAEVGPLLNNSAIPKNALEKQKELELMEKINKFAPDMLFVGFGAPKQEKWIMTHSDSLKVGFAMGIGRTLEWVSGDSTKAPEFVSIIGLEWLFRLITGSTNLKRIINAAILFPLEVYAYKLMKD